jgi:hypothetical protein
MNPDIDQAISNHRNDPGFEEACFRTAFLAGMRWSGQMASTILNAQVRVGEADFAEFLRELVSYVKKNKEPVAKTKVSRKFRLQ